MPPPAAAVSTGGVGEDGPSFIERCFVKLFDDTSFETLSSLDLDDYEQPFAVTTGEAAYLPVLALHSLTHTSSCVQSRLWMILSSTSLWGQRT